MMIFTGHEDNDSLKPYIAITDKTRKNLRTRFRGAALAASRGRPRGAGQPCNSPRPALFHVGDRQGRPVVAFHRKKDQR